MKYDVITFGSAIRDVFLESRGFKRVAVKQFGSQGAECFPFGGKVEVDRVTFDTGGGGANSACTFASLGFKTAVVSRLGNDGVGRIIRDRLCLAGVDDIFLTIDKSLVTGYSTILLSPSGERTALIHRGAARVFNTNHVPWSKLSSKWFYISSVGGNLFFLRRIMRRAKEAGARAAWNPGSLEIGKGLSNLEVILRRCDYFQVNLEEAAKLTKQTYDRLDRIFDRLEDIGAPTTVITDGERGAYMLSGGKRMFASVPPHECVNATGAGDAFGSGFVAGLLKYSGDVEAAFRLAVLNGASVVCEMGAQRGLLKKWPSGAVLRKVSVRAM